MNNYKFYRLCENGQKVLLGKNVNIENDTRALDEVDPLYIVGVLRDLRLIRSSVKVFRLSDSELCVEESNNPENRFIFEFSLSK